MFLSIASHRAGISRLCTTGGEGEFYSILGIFGLRGQDTSHFSFLQRTLPSSSFDSRFIIEVDCQAMLLNSFSVPPPWIWRRENSRCARTKENNTFFTVRQIKGQFWNIIFLITRHINKDDKHTKKWKLLVMCSSRLTNYGRNPKTVPILSLKGSKNNESLKIDEYCYTLLLLFWKKGGLSCQMFFSSDMSWLEHLCFSDL